MKAARITVLDVQLSSESDALGIALRIVVRTSPLG